MLESIRRLVRRSCIAELLVAVLALHALVPAGYMPGVGADGLPGLVLCSINAPLSAQTPADGTSAPERGGDVTDHLDRGMCPFTGLAQAALPASGLFYRPPATVHQPVSSAEAGAFVARPTPRSRLPRGPPVIA